MRGIEKPRRITALSQRSKTSNSEKMCRQISNKKAGALAGVAQWIEHGPENQRVTSSIPSQGTCLGCGPGPQYGACERQPHIDVSLTLFCPPFLSL